MHALVQPTYIIYYIHFLDGSDLNRVLEIWNSVPQATTTTLIEGTTRLPTYIDVRYVHGGSFFSGISCSQIFHVSHVFVSCLLFFFTHACIYQRPFKYTYIYYVRLPNFVNKKQGGSCDNTTPSQQQLSALNFDDRRNFRSQKWQQLMRTFFCIVYRGVRWDCYEILVKLRRGFPYQGAVS